MNPGISIDLKLGARVARLHELFSDRHRMSRHLIGRASAVFGPSWVADFDRTLRALCPDDASLESAAKGYSAFAFDSMRRQKAFEAARAYPLKTYAEASSEVYFNERHMSEEYLPGLLLSHFLWPHHYRQLQFFDTAFLAPLRQRNNVRFSEVGVGTGLYSCRTLEALPASTGGGYDISPSSCAFARQHVQAIGASERYLMVEQDIIAHPIDSVPALICVEVLEHLEDPVTFLKALRRGLAPDGRAFITAALNAAHADHIFLYRNGEEVHGHLRQAGFTLEQAFVGAAYAPPAVGVPVPLAAAFVVY